MMQTLLNWLFHASTRDSMKLYLKNGELSIMKLFWLDKLKIAQEILIDFLC